MMNPAELKERSKGMFVIAVTPFNDNDEVDYEGLKGNVDYVVKELQGKEASLVTLGSTSEMYALSDEETRQVIKTVVETVNGRLPVWVGTGRAGTKEAVSWSKYAESAGADGVMVVLPYYHTPTEEGMYQHYKHIAKRINIGVMIYNNTGVSGCWIRPPLMARLAEIPNIIANKENAYLIGDQYAMLRAIDPAKMNVVVGLGEVMFSYMSLWGSPGYISTDGNFAPLFFYGFWEAAKQNDYAKMKQLLASAEPLVRFHGRLSNRSHTSVHGAPFNRATTFISVIKAAMNMLGLCGGHVRLPLMDLTEADVQELKSILEGMKMLPARVPA